MSDLIVIGRNHRPGEIIFTRITDAIVISVPWVGVGDYQTIAVAIEHAREALKPRLPDEARFDVNANKFGMFGYNNTHNAIPTT